ACSDCKSKAQLSESPLLHKLARKSSRTVSLTSSSPLPMASRCYTHLWDGFTLIAAANDCPNQGDKSTFQNKLTVPLDKLHNLGKII
ncbi:MAG: hypothetical protein NZ602_12945, partial [Thermoguttaceae bacterium]|nr:hypothetical protein [Thermoguttaceae bacterium]